MCWKLMLTTPAMSKKWKHSLCNSVGEGQGDIFDDFSTADEGDFTDEQVEEIEAHLRDAVDDVQVRVRELSQAAAD